MAVHGIPELVGQFCATVAGFEIATAIIERLAFERARNLKPATRWLGLAAVMTVVAALLEWGVSSLVGSAILR